MPAAAYSVPPVRRRRYLRDQRLRELGFPSYAAYMKSSHWQRVRGRYRTSGLPQVCICEAEHGLDLHHKTYERVGAELLTDLVVLCRRCHALIHVLERRGQIGLDFVDVVDEVRAQLARTMLARAAVERDAAQDEFERQRWAFLDPLTFRERLLLVRRVAVARSVDLSRYELLLRSRIWRVANPESLWKRLLIMEWRVYGDTPPRLEGR